MDRLTERNERGFAYLKKVKPNEQDVESPYPNTLRCILDCFEELAKYEDAGLTPEEVMEYKKFEDNLVLKYKIPLSAALERIEKFTQLQAENASLRARLDKAVELPCEFGDIVYVLMSRGGTMEAVKGTVKNMRRYSGDTWWVEFSDLWVDKTLDDFGKTVFLAEAEAQAKLEEMKGGAE